MKIEITANTPTGREFVGEFEFPGAPSRGDEITLITRRGDAWYGRRVWRTLYTVESVTWSIDRDEPGCTEVYMLVREIESEEV